MITMMKENIGILDGRVGVFTARLCVIVLRTARRNEGKSHFHVVIHRRLLEMCGTCQQMGVREAEQIPHCDKSFV